MRIAYIGLKGLPGMFSGIETHVNELGTRLAKRGHDVRYMPSMLSGENADLGLRRLKDRLGMPHDPSSAFRTGAIAGLQSCPPVQACGFARPPGRACCSTSTGTSDMLAVRLGQLPA
jgi:hypothetical protein